MNWFSSRYWQPLAISLATLRRSTMVRLDGCSCSHGDRGANISNRIVWEEE